MPRLYESTNHLDVDARQALIQAISKDKGDLGNYRKLMMEQHRSAAEACAAELRRLSPRRRPARRR